MDPRLLANVGVVVFALEVSPTTLTNYVLNVLRICFVVSMNAPLTTKVSELEVEEICASLRFLVFKIEPRAGSK
jgi:hypothetical protein